LALLSPGYAEILAESVPDWPELQNSLNEIDAGLQMIDLPLSQIENNFAEREAGLSQKEQDLNAIELRLQQRESGLIEREKGLSARELLYCGMQVDLDRANKKLTRGWIWLLLAALVGGGLGYAIGR
jgi:chromosome segregation ATPase